MSGCKTYLKTSGLASARTPTGRSFKGQKALVIKAPLESGKGLTAQEIVNKSRTLYSDTLRGGSRGFVMTKYCGGGEKGLTGSVKVHLGQLLRKGLISCSES
jgi:hypothetical protein